MIVSWSRFTCVSRVPFLEFVAFVNASFPSVLLPNFFLFASLQLGDFYLELHWDFQSWGELSCTFSKWYRIKVCMFVSAGLLARLQSLVGAVK